MDASTITAIERILRPLLKSLGYYKIEFLDNEEAGKPYLLVSADGDMRKILLTVAATTSVRKNVSFPNEYIKTIKNLAVQKDREAWAAIFKVNAGGQLADSVEWSNLATVAV